MPLHPSWIDIGIRLLFTLFAGIVIGFNRGSRGQAAGFRTTILVGLAACVAMIQANILLSLAGKTGHSFAVMDLMRLPLGILTGVGFIGGGSILKKGDLVTGVTTAATLWIISVIGLCFGGGQIALGFVATILSLLTISVFKSLDTLIPRTRRAIVCISSNDILSVFDINKLIKPLGYFAYFNKKVNSHTTKFFEFEIHWKKSDESGPPLDLLNTLEKNYNVELFELTAEQTDHRQ
ncbi:MAG TPA: MgtC/SapB family protein [Puia sp.]|nr:MgtC/SapB family protein [Puia sp.]